MECEANRSYFAGCCHLPGLYEADDFKDISHYALIKLAKFYGVTADYLLGLTDIQIEDLEELLQLYLYLHEQSLPECSSIPPYWVSALDRSFLKED